MTTATLTAAPPALQGARVGPVATALAGPPVVMPGHEPVTSAFASALDDDALLTLQRSLAEQRRRIDASVAVVAAELSHRSRRELGAAGLAQSKGLRTGEALVQHLTGLTSTDTRSLIRAGTLMAEQQLPERETTAPWLRAVADAAAAGRISVAAVEAIRSGLGTPCESVTVAHLADAASTLLADASTLTPEQLAIHARQLRDRLDEAGIADREEERRQKRFLALTPLPDGMTRISGLLDPESAAVIVGAIDAATSPRRGGPRFVDESAPPLAEVEDDRSIPQLMADALVDLVKLATLADDGTVLGARRVGVRVHVHEGDLLRGAGAAHLEGQTAPVSITTAERIACDTGLTPIRFDYPGHPIDVGHTQRLFTPRQRIALAARDGGCRAPGCDRPPSWCEAHHIDEWLRHNGPTTLKNAILLCKFHHLLIHNRGWHIERDPDTEHEFVLVMPATVTTPYRRIPLPSRNPLAARQ